MDQQEASSNATQSDTTLNVESDVKTTNEIKKTNFDYFFGFLIFVDLFFRLMPFLMTSSTNTEMTCKKFMKLSDWFLIHLLSFSIMNIMWIYVDCLKYKKSNKVLLFSVFTLFELIWTIVGCALIKQCSDMQPVSVKKYAIFILVINWVIILPSLWIFLRKLKKN